MTDRERAEELCDRNWSSGFIGTTLDIIENTEAALKAVREEERERCVEVINKHPLGELGVLKDRTTCPNDPTLMQNHYEYVAQSIAKAIRETS